jgi:hypothetical protein
MSLASRSHLARMWNVDNQGSARIDRLFLVFEDFYPLVARVRRDDKAREMDAERHWGFGAPQPVLYFRT